jgi:Brp/Blh family beta-carotene 15,15'-monooxygenase
MTDFFAWRPLDAPSDTDAPGPSLARVANAGFAVLLIGALGQVMLGYESVFGAIVPLIIGALLFGLPHGAIDHLVILGLAKQKLRFRGVIFVCVLYLFLVGLFGLLWIVSPSTAAIVFLGMTIYHWGKADTAFTLTCRPSDSWLRAPWQRILHSIVRGLIPIGVPLLAFPAEVNFFLAKCTAIFGADPPTIESVSNLVAVTLIGFTLAEVTNLLRHYSNQSLFCLIEMLILFGFFILVPPLIAISWYFCFWHGLRHILRLSRYGKPTTIRSPIGTCMRQFFYRAIPFTLAALYLLFGLVAFRTYSSDLNDWIALYFILISALTFPHVLLVEWMDWREWQGH